MMHFLKRGIAVLLSFCMVVGLCVVPQMESNAKNKQPYFIKVNRKQCCVTVYEQDENGEYTVPIKAMVCSVGLNNATPKGSFTLSDKYRWHKMYFDVYAQYCTRITGHVLFHSVCYNGEGNPASLRFRDYNKLGSPASHGCIRLSTADAKWIYTNCGAGTKVKIYDGDNPGPLGKPQSVKINGSNPNRFWDPTDPSKENPWKKQKPTINISKKTLERGSSIEDLRKLAQAYNYLNNPLKVTISGDFQLSKVGKYEVRFRAEDYLGNVAYKKATIRVRDTIAPVIFFEKKHMKLGKKEWLKISEYKLKKMLLENVLLYDSKKLLPLKYVSLQYDELMDAISEGESGTYTVTVCGNDKAGNKAKERTFEVTLGK